MQTKSNESSHRSTRIAELEKRIAEYNATHGQIAKIKSQSVRDAHAKVIFQELVRFDVDDIIPLLFSALIKAVGSLLLLKALIQRTVRRDRRRSGPAGSTGKTV